MLGRKIYSLSSSTNISFLPGWTMYRMCKTLPGFRKRVSQICHLVLLLPCLLVILSWSLVYFSFLNNSHANPLYFSLEPHTFCNLISVKASLISAFYNLGLLIWPPSHSLCTPQNPAHPPGRIFHPKLSTYFQDPNPSGYFQNSKNSRLHKTLASVPLHTISSLLWVVLIEYYSIAKNCLKLSIWASDVPFHQFTTFTFYIEVQWSHL